MSVLICGHRGASGYAPENTLEAFSLAIELKADAVELDVHLSRDGELIVAHDERVDRVSNGTGLICMMSLKDLKRLDFNSLHPEYAAAKAPTLKEVFELIKPSGSSINVELKNSRIRYEGLEEKCLDLAAELGMEDRVLYSSFNHHSMLKIKRFNASAKCGLLYDCCLIEPWDYAKRLGMDAIHPHYSELLLNPDEGEASRKMGLMINTWTVNDERDMKKLVENGANMIITNYPDRAIAELRA